jgi:hypothetical protein
MQRRSPCPSPAGSEVPILLWIGMGAAPSKVARPNTKWGEIWGSGGRELRIAKRSGTNGPHLPAQSTQGQANPPRSGSPNPSLDWDGPGSLEGRLPERRNGQGGNPGRQRAPVPRRTGGIFDRAPQNAGGSWIAKGTGSQGSGDGSSSSSSSRGGRLRRASAVSSSKAAVRA